MPSSNIPEKFHPLLASKVDLFIIKKRVATNNLGPAKYSFPNRGTPKKPECFQKFQNKFLRFDEQIVSAPAGIYTWILKDFENGLGRHLVFAQTPSKQEVGTLHINLDFLTADGNVYIAGELQISEDRKYTYNILSGTYSAGLPAADQEARKDELKGVLVGYGIPEESIISNGYMPIINMAAIVMPPAMREFYMSCGMMREAEEPEEPKSSNKSGGARRRNRSSRRHRKHKRTIKRVRSPRNYSR